MAGTDQLSALFSALADPTRRVIPARPAERDATVTELTAPLRISMPAVSRHLKVLEHAALIPRTRSGRWRASHLEAAPLRDASDAPRELVYRAFTDPDHLAAWWGPRFRVEFHDEFTKLDATLTGRGVVARPS